TGQRLPEVALDEALQPIDVLRDHRPVQAELLTQRRQRLRRGVLAEERAGGVPGQRLGGREDDDRDEEERDDAERDPAEDEPPDAVWPREGPLGRSLDLPGSRGHARPSDRSERREAARGARRLTPTGLREPEGPVAIAEVVQLHDALPSLDEALQ